MTPLGKRIVPTPASPKLFYGARPTISFPVQGKVSRSHSKTRRRPFRLHHDKQTTAVIIALFLASAASLLTAYYLFFAASPHAGPLLPHWSLLETTALTTPILRSSVSSLALATPTPPIPTHVHVEKFLAYLPHSGFHNQRIALENALVLARIWNRTLLIPPVRLGVPFSYFPFDDLLEMSPHANKPWFEYCEQTALRDLDLSPECDDPMSYTHMSWDTLVDLSGIRGEQPMLKGWNFTDSWLHSFLNISVDDIFYLKDSTRNQFSFQDFPSFHPPARKFTQAINIAAIAQRSERLIQLGTLFGSARLHLRSDDNFRLRGRIREQMVFTNSYLLRAVSEIRRALGGDYLAVHLRIGNGVFEQHALENVRLAWWKLLHFALGFSHQRLLELEREFFPEEDDLEPPAIMPDLPALRSPHPPLPPFPANVSPGGQFSCRGALHSDYDLLALNAPLFIATDAENPYWNPLIWRFFRTFPCSFFLADFSDQTRPLATLHSDIDGVPLGPFLMPFVDAMVAGQAWQVIGTEQSTYSSFVTDVLWRRYHGFDIVQRG